MLFLFFSKFCPEIGGAAYLWMRLIDGRLRYFQYIINPRWLSLSGLILLLTASDMDPACEASLIVLG